LIAVTISAGLALLLASQIVVARTKAVAAADAAALAAAPMTFPPAAQGNSPERVAADFAMANGARLVRCDCVVVRTFDARAVEVEVALPVDLVLLGRREVRATSRAEFVP
jgi:hypothetical protein